MSKGKGQKIAIKFDKPILGDVSGQLPPILAGERLVAPRPGLVYAASATQGSQVPSLAFDGNISTYWESRAALPQWLRVDFGDRPEAVTRFRYYSGASYRINAYRFEASNDLEDWTILWSGNNAASTGWRDITFDNATAYRYYRFVVTSQHTAGRIYIYEVELYAGAGNEAAFTVSGMQRNPLKTGPLQPKTYPVERVERYPETDDTILLHFDTYNRFNDAEGNITVSYLQAVGTLAGVRPVEDFSESFEPEDLEATPIDDHTITAGTEVEVEFIPVDYVSGFTDHTVAAASSLEVQLIPVGEIPP